ncbi:hypothetical protein C7447_10753 [Tenacibaculum adriaticum]|uniref:Lipoprotein n=1 Tax=Tenacibaculum adriaticum TaxID=413713 RepID=A0A5S5DKP8_9FLAO|nr:hypothetical protein [Tenacibaculum adriaticum]TYP96487.1 hypothetical protein C7447_10753 [Tenacibaculum adriaticum]
MKTLFLKTALLLAVVTFFNCSNNDDPQDQLPPITQTGANTFGCIINGEILTPKDGRGVPQAKGLFVAHYSNNNIVFDVGNFKDDNGDSIYIYIYNLTSIGTYSFGLSTGQSISTFEPDFNHCWTRTFDTTTGGKKYLSNINSGTIIITRFDPINFIISGTFELTTFEENDPNNTIEITDGRFDINWSTI